MKTEGRKGRKGRKVMEDFARSTFLLFLPFLPSISLLQSVTLSPMLSLVLPTYNEAENLPILLPKLEETLAGIPHEIIVVDDDSPDGTWRRAEELSRQYPSLRVLRRREERGLSSAVIAGFKSARGEVLAVMDADGQHDYTLLHSLYDSVKKSRGVAVASRYIPGGGTGEWNRSRTLLSRAGTRIVMTLCGLKTHDPLSGFFAIDRALFERIAPSFTPRGFKILLDLLAHIPRGTRVTEVPYTFAPRLRGRSKLSLSVQTAFARSLLDILLFRYATPAWIVFLSLCVLLGAMFGWRAWNLHMLYTDASVRERTAQGIRFLNQNEGWLISDLSPRGIADNRLQMLYRPHLRAFPDARCLTVTLTYFGWSPCDAP